MENYTFTGILNDKSIPILGREFEGSITVNKQGVFEGQIRYHTHPIIVEQVQGTFDLDKDLSELVMFTNKPVRKSKKIVLDLYNNKSKGIEGKFVGKWYNSSMVHNFPKRAESGYMSHVASIIARYSTKCDDAFIKFTKNEPSKDIY